jgi:peptidoglycan/xylan/chitin deacetylase (PgdA/CDA1 family)
MVASHTWAHKDLSKLSLTQITSEMSRVDQALQRIIGVTPAFVRPPYGSYNNLVRQAAASRGQKLVIWDFDSGDSTGSTAAQSNAAYDKLANKHPKTILALNHEVYGVYFRHCREHPPLIVLCFDYRKNCPCRSSPCHQGVEG